MTVPKFAQRLGQAAEALELLSLHPMGLAITDLADLLGVSDYEIRGTLDSYSSGRSVDDLDGSGGGDMIFLDTEYGPDTAAESEDWFDRHCVSADEATWVRLERPSPGHAPPFSVLLGVEEIVQLLTYADSLQRTEPDNEPLREAIAALRLRWFPEATLSGRVLAPSIALPILRRAIAEQRQVRFVYDREWLPGVAARIVEPYALRRTRLGFELDAGPVRDNGRIRTFLLRNIWNPELLPEAFERPAEVDALIAANRDVCTATVVVPKMSQRTYEGLVQDERLVREDPQPDGDRELEITLQQPFAERLAMFMFRAGPDALVVSPPELRDVAADRARQLLAHHGLD